MDAKLILISIILLTIPFAAHTFPMPPEDHDHAHAHAHGMVVSSAAKLPTLKSIAQCIGKCAMECGLFEPNFKCYEPCVAKCL